MQHTYPFSSQCTVSYPQGSFAVAFDTVCPAQGTVLRVHPDVKYKYWPSSGWIPQAVMKASLQSGSPELMTAEQVKNMTVADHQCLWRVSVAANQKCF